MNNRDEQQKRVISGEFTFPFDAETTAKGIDPHQGSFVPRHVFSATTQVESTSLLRINKQLSGDFSRLGPDTRGIRTDG